MGEHTNGHWGGRRAVRGVGPPSGPRSSGSPRTWGSACSPSKWTGLRLGLYRREWSFFVVEKFGFEVEFLYLTL